MSSKISNSVLRQIIALHSSDISIAISECALKINIPSATLSSWHNKVKIGKWKTGYTKTEDKEPLLEDNIEKFKNCFGLSGKANKILKKLLTSKTFHSKNFFEKQHVYLRRLVKKYPDINFWLYVDFGNPIDDLVMFFGKGDALIKKKYIDFSASDSYTPFEYSFTETSPQASEKRVKTLWDYYE